MNLRLMTSNVWGDYFGNSVHGRDAALGAVFRKYAPDILGLQEMTANWNRSDLYPSLKTLFTLVPVETGGRNNYTPLLYQAGRFELLESGWALYHEKLDESKGYTFGVFREKNTFGTTAVFCTHFWWKPDPGDTLIRCRNAEMLSEAMNRIRNQYHCPVFFLGDLNCRINSSPWQVFKDQGWRSSFEIAQKFSPWSSLHGDPVLGEDQRLHGKTTAEPKEKSIDHIGIDPDATVSQQDLATEREALDASDHSPVYADIHF